MTVSTASSGPMSAFSRSLASFTVKSSRDSKENKEAACKTPPGSFKFGSKTPKSPRDLMSFFSRSSSQSSLSTTDDSCSSSDDADDDIDSVIIAQGEDVIKTLESASAAYKCPYEIIPKFFVAGQRNCAFNKALPTDALSADKIKEIKAIFRPYPQRCMPWNDFYAVTKNLLQMPSFLNKLLVQRIHDHYLASTSGASLASSPLSPSMVNCQAFLSYWAKEVAPYDRIERLFRLLKQTSADSIYPDDLIPLVQEIMDVHPGLQLLRAPSQVESAKKYLLTVITRMYYKINTSRTGKISMKEFRTSNLLSTLEYLDNTKVADAKNNKSVQDINNELDYFNYQHFYVMYSTFLSLDEDKDGYLNIKDLQRYGAFALTPISINRLYQVGEKAMSDGELGFRSRKANVSNGMTFADFVYFFSAEIDKHSVQSIRYWFRLCDYEMDHTIKLIDAQRLYKNQYMRLLKIAADTNARSAMSGLSCRSADSEDACKATTFDEMIIQMHDFIQPGSGSATASSIAAASSVEHAKDNNCVIFRLEDFTSALTSRNNLEAGMFFNALFNCTLYLHWDQRSFQEKKMKLLQFQQGDIRNDWDRFAECEYIRMEQEEKNKQILAAKQTKVVVKSSNKMIFPVDSN